MNQNDVNEFHIALLEQRHESIKIAGERFAHVQDGSKEMAETMCLEAFKKASDAIDNLLTFGCIPTDEPSNIKAIIVKVEGEVEK